MQRAAMVMLWLGVMFTGVFLRFEHLATRPFHADEATGARITAKRMESGDARFDPKHYHGPLLADLAIPLCLARGETRWQDLTKTTLRVLPAVAGSLLVLLPLLWRRRFGDAPMLLAAALLATSPLLVYYSRMFIHEMLLAFFGMAALFALTRQPRWGIPGLLIGLMFATKESFAISIIAWSAAGVLVLLENRRLLDRQLIATAWRQYRLPVAVSLVAAAITAAAFYTDGFRHPQGAVDAVRTFFVYETVAGHDKPAHYYLQLLVVPHKAGGLWWFGTPVAALALLAYLATFRRGPVPARERATIRFIAYAAAGHFLIYSLIAYKTPWLACLPWAHVCLLAGFSLTAMAGGRLPLRIAVAAVAAGCLVTQFRQTRFATGRFAADDRNPFAYVPTRNDVEALVRWLDQLRTADPDDKLEPVGVIGTDYWPLPWYLRSFSHIGYWSAPPDQLPKLPLVLAMPDAAAAVRQALATTHQELPRGLRAGVPLEVFVRKDIWKRWMDTAQP